MEQDLYSWDGKKKGKIELPEKLFSLPWNADLVHQVVTAMRANSRTNTAVARGRGDVRGGGKKPWKQKGTGRARHGSTRSPIWKGGGVTHGPTAERSYDQKVNKRMKQRALFTVLSQKLREGNLFLVEGSTLAKPKTKDAAARLSGLSSGTGAGALLFRKGRRALIATPTLSQETVQSYRNIPTVLVEEVRNLNPVDVMTYQYLVIENPKEGIPVLESRGTFTRQAS